MEAVLAGACAQVNKKQDLQAEHHMWHNRACETASLENLCMLELPQTADISAAPLRGMDIPWTLL